MSSRQNERTRGVAWKGTRANKGGRECQNAGILSERTFWMSPYEKQFFRALSSRKWRISWDRFEPKTKFKIQIFLRFCFLEIFVLGSNLPQVAPFLTTYKAFMLWELYKNVILTAFGCRVLVTDCESLLCFGSSWFLKEH